MATPKKSPPKTIRASSNKLSSPLNLCCLCCGKPIKDIVSECYKSPKSTIYKAYEGFIPIHKTCAQQLVETWKIRYKDEKKAYMFACFVFDKFFDEETYEGFRTSPNFNLGNFFSQDNMGKNKFRNKTFLNYLEVIYDFYEYYKGDIDEDGYIGINTDKVQNINTSKDETKLDVIPVIDKAPVFEDKWTKEDEKNQKYVISVVGYDPFEKYTSVTDKRKLYSEAIRFFGDNDDIADDGWLISQILQIINTNQQIRQYDEIMAELDPSTDSEKISKISDIKYKLVQANDKIAKENEISVKNRSNKEVGKNTLSYLLKFLRENGFEKAEANYYDQLRSEGMDWIIGMSYKALKANGFFDENDYNEIILQNKELVDTLYKKNDDLQEENRLLKIKIKQLEIGDGHDS